MRERHARWLFVLLVVAQFVLLSRQVGRRQDANRWLERAGLRLLGPLAEGVNSGGHLLAGISESWHRRATLEAENQELRKQVASLERQLLARQETAGEVARLARAVGYAKRWHRSLRFCDVVYADYASWLRSIILYVGPQGAPVDAPVVADDGLVGRVVVVAGSYAKVQLVTDRASAVGAMLERTRRQGIVRGLGKDLLELDYVPLQADVRVGDRVVTAGIDGVYPREIPIGVVSKVEAGPQLFHHIEVVPQVDFGLLDHAYLLAAEALTKGELTRAESEAP